MDISKNELTKRRLFLFNTISKKRTNITIHLDTLTFDEPQLYSTRSVYAVRVFENAKLLNKKKKKREKERKNREQNKSNLERSIFEATIAITRIRSRSPFPPIPLSKYLFPRTFPSREPVNTRGVRRVTRNDATLI